MKTNIQKGFTLIELMIVVAIIAILAAIAIPQYQDYTKRSKVSEGLVLADAAKLAVSETYQSKGDWPVSTGAAGYQTARTTYVKELTIGAKGQIKITYQNIGVGINDSTILLTPTASQGAVQWDCNGAAGLGGDTGTVASKYLPANCRKTN
ncbi:MAG: pilin [Luteibacter sp.]